MKCQDENLVRQNRLDNFAGSEIEHPEGMPERRITWRLFVNDFEQHCAAMLARRAEYREVRSNPGTPAKQ
jgi:hypothetical protein